MPGAGHMPSGGPTRPRIACCMADRGGLVQRADHHRRQEPEDLLVDDVDRQRRPFQGHGGVAAAVLELPIAIEPHGQFSSRQNGQRSST